MKNLYNSYVDQTEQSIKYIKLNRNKRNSS